MSGGSLGYLYIKDVEDLFNPVMIEFMIEVEEYLLQNNASDVARDVRRLIEYIYTARNRIEVLHGNLSGVFKAVEWYQSCGWSKTSVDKAIDEYRDL